MPELDPVEATDEELWAGTCTEVLPDFVAREGGLFAAAGTPLTAGRLSVGGGIRKLETLGAREGTDVRGMKDVRALVLSRCSHPCNSFSASIANWKNWLTMSNSL